MNFNPSILFFAGQLYFCELMFLIDKPKRKLFPLRMIFGFAAYLTLSYFITWIPLQHYLMMMFWYIGIIIYSLALNLFVFKANLFEDVFALNAGYAIQNGIFSLNSVVGFFLPSFDFSTWSGRLSYDVLFQILPYVLFWIPFYFIVVKKRVQNGILAKQNWKVFLMLVIVVAVTICLGVLSGYRFGDYIQYNRFQSQVIFRISIIICCILMLVLQFSICTIDKNKRDIDLLNCMIEMQKNQYQLSKNTIDLLNVKFHDLKHQLSSIQLLNDDEKAKQLEEVKKKASVYNSIAKTGNASLDLVLMEKNLLCHKYNIALSYIVKNGSEMSFIQAGDLYSILANAFDNAIDYVKNLDDEKKYINLNISKKLDKFFLHMDNYLEKTPVMEDGLPVSTKKEEKELHGYGIRSMKMIAEKYGGELSVTVLRNSFELNIMIPVIENE